MITANQLIRLADQDAVAAVTVERDYVLTHALAEIASRREACMVFKGGTALRLCYIEDYRYSADLDFSLIEGLTVPRAREIVADALDRVRERVGFPQLVMTSDMPPQIAYVGPLGRERTIKLDIAADELVEETTDRPVFMRYDDQQGEIEVQVYTLDEIAAEKLRCILQRLECRDLFDLYELFEHHDVRADEAWPTFQRKARHRGFDPAGFADRFETRMTEYRRRWDGELDDHVPGAPPSIDAVERVVRRHLRSLLRR